MITRLLGSSVQKSTDIRFEVDTAKSRISGIEIPQTAAEIKALSSFVHARYRCKDANIKKMSLPSYDRGSIQVKQLETHDEGDYFV